jgi:peptidoglycan/xylan/chitin deacetylase (PgdA/CDA1 family)
MTKKKLQLRQRLAQTLISVFVLAVVILPMLLTARWVSGFAGTNDSRKVSKAAPFETRQVDKSNTTLKPFEQPIITITFDDGWETVYTKALPTLQKYGFQTTQYVITGTLDDHGYMSEAQLKSMKASGHEIAAHTVTHPDLTTLTDSQLDKELKDSKDTINKDFGPTQDFTSPYGAYNAHTIQEIGKFYRSQKNAEGDPSANELESINVKGSFNALNIKSYSVRDSTTIYDLQKLVEDAQKHNGWLVLTYHQIDYSRENYSVNPQEFEKQIKYLSSLNIRSATVGQVLDTVAPREKKGV